MTKFIPWKDNSAHVSNDFCTQRRLEETIKFIDAQDMAGRVLDIGEDNWVKYKIGKHFCKDIESYGGDWDLNRGMAGGRAGLYDTILCLEVLEHLVNPGLLVESMFTALKPGGILYLSTPVHNPLGFFFNRTCHFAEYKEESISELFHYVGFDILDHKTFRSIPPVKGYIQAKGLVRTSLRIWSQRTQLWRVRKP
jgi:SAM-dependent methyltransferase